MSPLIPFLLGSTALVLLRKPSSKRPRAAGGASKLTVVPVTARISSGFGWRKHPIIKDAAGNPATKHHNGYDLACPLGTPVYAAGNGVVEFAGWNKGYGNLTRIDHGGGLSTRYGHQSKLLVSAGQQVKAGQKIGLVGSTGMSTGPHLHFEVRVNNQPVDPSIYLPALRNLPSSVGGISLHFDHEIDDAQRQAYFTAHWPQMKAMAPDLSKEPKRTQEAFRAALAWFESNYPRKPFGAAEDAYRRFRHKNHSLHLQTPVVRKFFAGVLGRIDDMILYEAMRQANWRWRQRTWGRKGPPPVASDGDKV